VLVDLIPPAQFAIAVQAAIGAKSLRAPPSGRTARTYRQVLRRRHHPQAQAAGEAEGRQEAHEAVRQGGHSQEAFIAVLKTKQ
jgi:translation elongation factor EF-4